MRVVWSPVALERVSEIAGFISQDNLMAARKWAESVFESVEQLKDFPESGRRVQEAKRSDIREILHGHYRIIYRVAQSHIAVLTVRHGRQILPSAEFR